MTDYELIMCIVNTGFSETVMEAAKEQGARGGTVLHARGTANKEAEEFFNITVQPDKEIVMIVVPSTIRDDVLHAVYQAAGLKTAGQGISFALPVTNTVGLTPVNKPAESEQAKETPSATETTEPAEQAESTDDNDDSPTEE